MTNPQNDLIDELLVNMVGSLFSISSILLTKLEENKPEGIEYEKDLNDLFDAIYHHFDRYNENSDRPISYYSKLVYKQVENIFKSFKFYKFFDSYENNIYYINDYKKALEEGTIKKEDIDYYYKRLLQKKEQTKLKYYIKKENK
jgi:hypothetical protein